MSDVVFISEDVLFEVFSFHLPVVWAADIQCRFVFGNQTDYRKYCIMNIFLFIFYLSTFGQRCKYFMKNTCGSLIGIDLKSTTHMGSYTIEHTYFDTHTHTRLCVCVCVCVCVFPYVRTYIYIYLHTQTRYIYNVVGAR